MLQQHHKQEQALTEWGCSEIEEGSSPKALGTGLYGAEEAGREPDWLGTRPCPVKSLPVEFSRQMRLRELARDEDCTAHPDIRIKSQGITHTPASRLSISGRP